METSLIIIFLLFAVFYLVYKYQQIGKNNIKIIKAPKQLPKRKNNYMSHRDIMPHMTYSAGPFDEYMWKYPENGGNTITSQTASPYGHGPIHKPGLMPRHLPGPNGLVPFNSINPRYMGKYPFYYNVFA